MRLYAPRSFGDLCLQHVQTLHEATRGLDRNLARFVDPVPHRALWHAGKLSQATHRPAGAYKITKVTIDGDGAHARNVLPTIGDVKERSTWRL